MEAFAPFIRLDQAFFDHAAANCRVPRQTREISVTDIAPSAPVLLVSPYVVSDNGEPLKPAFVTAEFITNILGL